MKVSIIRTWEGGEGMKVSIIRTLGRWSRNGGLYNQNTGKVE